jgi:hypothetical protein
MRCGGTVYPKFAIRQDNLEEVKNIIEKKPDLLNSIAGPQPKKDHG